LMTFRMVLIPTHVCSISLQRCGWNSEIWCVLLYAIYHSLKNYGIWKSSSGIFGLKSLQKGGASIIRSFKHVFVIRIIWVWIEYRNTVI
jgi:hypothetical protein